MDGQLVAGPFESEDLARRAGKKTNSFKRILLNKCQTEFEKECEAIPSGLSEEDKAMAIREKTQVKKRILGNIRFIGELFKKNMLQEKIMHECVLKLMGLHTADEGGKRVVLKKPKYVPDEEDIESLCKLVSTIGKMLDHKQSRDLVNQYFDHMGRIAHDVRFSSRTRFMVQDLIELRQSRWEPRRMELEQKSLEDIRKDAEKEERQANQGQRGGGKGGPSGKGGKGGKGGGGAPPQRGASPQRVTGDGSVAQDAGN